MLSSQAGKLQGGREGSQKLFGLQLRAGISLMAKFARPPKSLHMTHGGGSGWCGWLVGWFGGWWRGGGFACAAGCGAVPLRCRWLLLVCLRCVAVHSLPTSRTAQAARLTCTFCAGQQHTIARRGAFPQVRPSVAKAALSLPCVELGLFKHALMIDIRAVSCDLALTCSRWYMPLCCSTVAIGRQLMLIWSYLRVYGYGLGGWE